MIISLSDFRVFHKCYSVLHVNIGFLISIKITDPAHYNYYDSAASSLPF